MGLVDAFGGIDDAVAEAARRAKLDPATTHAVWLEKEPGWREALTAMFSDGHAGEGPASDLLSVMAHARIAMLGQAIADADLLTRGSAVQVRCFDCPAPAAVAIQPRTVMQMMLDWVRA